MDIILHAFDPTIFLFGMIAGSVTTVLLVIALIFIEE